jgi:predicted enzyme related to lactoylglutathione lyase
MRRSLGGVQLFADAARRGVKETSVGHVVHFEFSVPDPEQTAAFYRAAFGWVATKLPDPLKYWQLQTFQTDRHLGLPGGIVESKTGESRVSLTIQVESMDEVCAKVTSLGGQLVTERRFVPGYGVHVLCKDPQGCFFALIEPPKGA